jgi:hypothetical protein
VCKGRPPIFAFSSLKKLDPQLSPLDSRTTTPIHRCRHHSPLLAALDFVLPSKQFQLLPHFPSSLNLHRLQALTSLSTRCQSIVRRVTPEPKQTATSSPDTFTRSPPTTTTTLSLPHPSTMASPSVQNPPTAAASKAPKKKKGKSESTESPAPASATPEKAASAAGDNQDDVSDAPHIRELKK